MRIVMLNGSAHVSGCTATALNEMIKVFSEEGIETELIQVGASVVSCRRGGNTATFEVLNKYFTESNEHV